MKILKFYAPFENLDLNFNYYVNDNNGMEKLVEIQYFIY